MMKPVVSKDFNLEDIRKIREYNSLRHIQMTHEEIIEDNRKGAAVVLELLQQSGTVDIGKVFGKGNRRGKVQVEKNHPH